MVGKVRGWEPGKIGGRGYRSWERKGQEVGVLKGWEEGKKRGNYATIESHDTEKGLWGIIYVLTIKLSSLHVRQ